MANMEILSRSYINTTTMFSISPADATTTSRQYALDLERLTQYVSDNSTAGSIGLEFGTNRIVTHLLLVNHNLENFTVYANTLTGAVIATVSGNSASSTYLSFASTTLSAIKLNISADATYDGQPWAIGEVRACEKKFSFERNPPIKNFQYKTYRKQVVHEMADGGTSTHTFRDKFRTAIKYDHITASFTAQLQSVYSTGEDFTFLPFPTTTAWDGSVYSVAWVGGFDFRYATNDKGAGYSGSLTLNETSTL
jgi:hypothetical protein